MTAERFIENRSFGPTLFVSAKNGCPDPTTTSGKTATNPLEMDAPCAQPINVRLFFFFTFNSTTNKQWKKNARTVAETAAKREKNARYQHEHESENDIAPPTDGKNWARPTCRHACTYWIKIQFYSTCF